VAELHALHPNIYPDFPSEISHPSRRLNKEDKIAAVMVFMDPLNWERDMQILCDVLRSDGSLYHVHDVSSPQTVALYMSCPDLLYSTDAPTPRFGSGAFCPRCHLGRCPCFITDLRAQEHSTSLCARYFRS
jgi:hypothetical protein